MLSKVEKIKKEPILSECAIHGPNATKIIHVYSYICVGYVCIECVKDHCFIDDIETEIIEEYPSYFGVIR